MTEYIDKQTVLDIITEYEKTQIKHKGTPIPGFASIAIEIEDLPAADVRKNVKGKWTREVLGSTSGYGTTVMYRCSACKTLSINEYRSCPNCGADMRGKHDG